MRPFLKIVLLFILLFAGWNTLSGQTYYTFSFDRHQSENFGAANLITLHKALYTFQDSYVPDSLFRENRAYKKAGGFFYRMARFCLLDAQFDYLTMLTQHEVFGHGARYREMGYRENAFHLNLFFPYGDGSGYAKTGNLSSGYKTSVHEHIAMVFAGNEANQVLSNQLEARMLLDGDIHYRQASLFLISRNNLPAYIWHTRLFKKEGTFASDDIQSYIFGINNLWVNAGSPLRISINELSAECLMSLLNPMQLYSAYTVLVSYGIKGHKTMGALPMIPLGPVRYLPSFNYTLTPFGPQAHLMNYVKWDHRLFSADLAYGIGGLYRSYGIQLSAMRLLQKPWLEMDAQCDFWRQQALWLDDYNYPRTTPKAGGAATVSFYAHPLKNSRSIGLFLQAGYKTKGYMHGQDLDQTLILRYGLSGKF